MERLMVSADDNEAIVVILSKYVRIVDGINRDNKIREEAGSRLAAAEKQRQNCVAAFRIFDFDISQDSVFDAIKERIGENAWNRAIDVARPMEEMQESNPLPPPTVEENEEPTENHSIKDLVLSRLALGAVAGVRASEIRNFVQQSIGKIIHEKTVGMTLYRLQKEGLVRRDGHIWFLAETRVEAGNPGAGSAGAD
jgi:hypothetical protein